jgi:hypothetical protein
MSTSFGGKLAKRCLHPRLRSFTFNSGEVMTSCSDCNFGQGHYDQSIPTEGKMYRKLRRTFKHEKRVIWYVNGEDYPFTRSEKYDWQQDENRIPALHESSHAVAAWMVGEPIEFMKFNRADGSSLDTIDDDSDDSDDFVAETATGLPLPEIHAKSEGERLVHGLHAAFITLAGVVGSGETQSEELFTRLHVSTHLADATNKLMHIAGISETAARKECIRLMRVVDRTFADPRVQGTVKHLATNLIRLRHMTGEEVTAVIAQAWTELDKAYKASAVSA